MLTRLLWMRSKGIRFNPIWGRQAVNINGRLKFDGDLTLEAWGGGPGLVASETSVAARAGVDIRYGVGATDLLFDAFDVR